MNDTKLHTKKNNFPLPSSMKRSLSFKPLKTFYLYVKDELEHKFFTIDFSTFKTQIFDKKSVSSL